MQSEERRHFAGVNPDDVHRYDIFRLAAALPAPEWRNSVSLAFPPSDAAALEGNAVTPASIGLLGMAGALPYSYTEAVARSGGTAARAFMDLLSAPAIGLFCRAWQQARPECTPLPAMPVLRGPLRARAVGEILSQALGVPVHIEQFSVLRASLARDQCTTLGAGNAHCGQGALLGGSLRRLDSAVRIHIGPLDRQAAQFFLPGARGALSLAQLWRGTAGDAGLRAEACVHLLPGAGEGATLGASARLGYDALVAARPLGERDDLRYRLC